MDMRATEVIKQHLIDPEICIRCNTCEATCPVGAITHDARNYVVDVDKCNACLDCIAPCPTGAIDNWRRVPRGKSYSVAEQLLWDELPPELTPARIGGRRRGGEPQDCRYAMTPMRRRRCWPPPAP